MSLSRPALEGTITNVLSALVIAGAGGFLVVIAFLPQIAELVQNALVSNLSPTMATVASTALGVGATIFLITQLPIFLIWLERKVAAHIQDRLGPMRVGWHGVLQSFADGIKLLFKEDIIVLGADRILFKLAPFVVVMGAFAAFAVLPWGEGLVVSNLNIGLLYAVAITSFGAIGILRGCRRLRMFGRRRIGMSARLMICLVLSLRATVICDGYFFLTIGRGILC